MKVLVGALGFLLISSSSIGIAHASNEVELASLQVVPHSVPKRCKRAPRKTQILFDLCRDQLAVLEEAKQLAKDQGKIVLVSYGADWCIWCHALEAHLLGRYGTFTHKLPDGPWHMTEDGSHDMAIKAAELAAFSAEHFVVANIAAEGDTSAQAVLRSTQAEAHFSGGLPFVYSLDSAGRYSGAMSSVDVEVRRDGDDPYRGYDRSKLLAVLKAFAGSNQSSDRLQGSSKQ